MKPTFVFMLLVFGIVALAGCQSQANKEATLAQQWNASRQPPADYLKQKQAEAAAASAKLRAGANPSGAK